MSSYPSGYPTTNNSQKSDMDSRERSSHIEGEGVDGCDGRYYGKSHLRHSSSDHRYTTSLSTSISSQNNNNNNNNNNNINNGNNNNGGNNGSSGYYVSNSNNSTGYGNIGSSNIDSLKSSLTSGGSYNPSNTLSSSTTSNTSFHTAASGTVTHPTRNTGMAHSPQLRLNVENGNVDFTSPSMSPKITSGISKKDIHGNPLKLSMLNTTDPSTSEKCEKKFNLSLSSSSPSSPSFSNTSPFPDFIPTMESVIRKANYPMITPEKRKEDLDADTIREKLNNYEREKKKDTVITAGSVRDNIRKIERDKEKDKDKDKAKEFEREREEIRNSTPLCKSDLRPPRVNRTVSLPAAMKVQGTYYNTTHSATSHYVMSCHLLSYPPICLSLSLFLSNSK